MTKLRMKRKSRVLWHRVYKSINIVSMLSVIFYTSMIGVFFVPKSVGAGSGAIWTTNGSCGNPQNVNEYNIGDIIYINGSGFNAGDYDWYIEGQPGNASTDPNIKVAPDPYPNLKTVDASGLFCFNAYTVKADDDGVYQVKFGNVKGDNYHVNGTYFGSISGFKYQVTDKFDPAYENGDQKLDGWTIELYNLNVLPVPPPIKTMITGDDTTPAGAVNLGEFKFIDLPAGKYWICEDISGHAGWFQYWPISGSVFDQATNKICHEVTLTAGQNVIDKKFGNYYPECGNDIKDSGEECDDGNLDNNDGCSAACLNEYCGDGIVQTTEQCDGDAPRVCTTAEGYAGTETCYMGNVIAVMSLAATTRPMCVWDSCEPTEWCGDGIQNGNEACDGVDGVGPHQSCTQSCTLQDLTYCGNLTKETPNDEGTGGPLNDGNEACDGVDGIGVHQSCSATCELEYVPYCGDGNIDVGEDCDDGNTDDNDACKNDCTINSHTCGNGILQTNLDEVCDAGANNGVVCTPAYGSTCDYCSDTCQPVTLTGGFCGDNIKNGTEACDGTDGITGNQTCTANCTIFTPTVTATPVITLVKTDTPDPVKAGENITYTLTYTISGANVTGLKIVDTLAANTTFISASNSGAFNNTTNKVSWDLGDVPIGSYSVTLTVKVAGVIANGTVLTNTAVLDTNENDPKTDEETTTVNSGAVLTIVKSVEKSPVYPGDSVNYIITIKNVGSDTANNLRLADTMPAGFTYDDGSDGSWFFGDLAVGEEKNFIYSVTVGTTVVAGTYTNTAQVSADNATFVKDTADLEIIAKPGVVLGAETEGAVEAAEETLPAAGSDVGNYLLYILAIAVAAFGTYGFRKVAVVKK